MQLIPALCPGVAGNSEYGKMVSSPSQRIGRLLGETNEVQMPGVSVHAGRGSLDFLLMRQGSGSRSDVDATQNGATELHRVTFHSN